MKNVIIHNAQGRYGRDAAYLRCEQRGYNVVNYVASANIAGTDAGLIIMAATDPSQSVDTIIACGSREQTDQIRPALEARGLEVVLLADLFSDRYRGLIAENGARREVQLRAYRAGLKECLDSLAGDLGQAIGGKAAVEASRSYIDAHPVWQLEVAESDLPAGVLFGPWQSGCQAARADFMDWLGALAPNKHALFEMYLDGACQDR